MPTPDPQKQFEALQVELATRNSIKHFAHAGVAIIASLIVAGAAGKLAWDSYKNPLLGVSVSLIALGLWIYAFVNYRVGARLLRTELERYESMMALRRALKLDDPVALLPQQ